MNEQPKPATCTQEGTAKRWSVALYGTKIFTAPYQAQMEALAIDINIAIRRHERKQSNEDAVKILEGMERKLTQPGVREEAARQSQASLDKELKLSEAYNMGPTQTLNIKIRKAIGNGALEITQIAKAVKFPLKETRAAVDRLVEAGVLERIGIDYRNR